MAALIGGGKVLGRLLEAMGLGGGGHPVRRLVIDVRLDAPVTVYVERLMREGEAGALADALAGAGGDVARREVSRVEIDEMGRVTATPLNPNPGMR